MANSMMEELEIKEPTPSLAPSQYEVILLLPLKGRRYLHGWPPFTACWDGTSVVV